ncbi:helix-turn-helix domain-containing protein [Yersinia enterocolitica]|uniref:helix-turn-helix domain-containing protein n=1 Tax=Yersinia enterocolitica TaxID=630 RepID=UPI002A14E22C|nr:helix-turn-helix domain-containing protein [Yersinia enterocolitica]EKN3794821.1 helix-turn-helix domain-containing protein [Yersinia enterocolitica]EKN3876022.1 helix-turn-helix domain-containing protein [Yersinia enterocolitica]EKN4173550.1 helix-turn-helix domain-containing protein [Yersinia enterocolitica]ELY5227101.1 helix-turn-helix domain-containing protein [Yersinia enterocolitica]
MDKYSLTFDEACEFLGVSRSTAKKWISSGRLAATRKDPSKQQSPYLLTRKACIAALSDPVHTVSVIGGGATKEIQCQSSAGVSFGMPTSRHRTENALNSLLAQRTSAKHRSCTTD